MTQVNRKTEFSGGKSVAGDHTEIDPITKQQKGYVVLAAEDRRVPESKAVRMTYVHTGAKPEGEEFDIDNMDLRTIYERFGGCGNVTRMSRDIAETMAADPSFYTGTFCSGCKKHFPLNQFMWENTKEFLG